MPICPICRTNHDPGMLCIDRTGEMLKDIGDARKPSMTEREFKEAARKTDGIITYRGEKIRIISVRRSRKEEVEIYEGESS